ncbi:hypothetical protein EJ06DRAFT_375864 [Trichodelitschia bisporula]|uniref:Uncharacterized protein n=1 Tax=Trichodelitschia bisporula TaxID=703511 RepID=A0A6G1HYE9_9PEZI|nr:hypothetical protein EJ06DRAFT_375864 [Trichodelitschia bisporula]
MIRDYSPWGQKRKSQNPQSATSIQLPYSPLPKPASQSKPSFQSKLTLSKMCVIKYTYWSCTHTTGETTECAILHEHRRTLEKVRAKHEASRKWEPLSIQKLWRRIAKNSMKVWGTPYKERPSPCSTQYNIHRSRYECGACSLASAEDHPIFPETNWGVEIGYSPYHIMEPRALDDALYTYEEDSLPSTEFSDDFQGPPRGGVPLYGIYGNRDSDDDIVFSRRRLVPVGGVSDSGEDADDELSYVEDVVLPRRFLWRAHTPEGGISEDSGADWDNDSDDYDDYEVYDEDEEYNEDEYDEGRRHSLELRRFP